jgi:hypothetical protein
MRFGVYTFALTAILCALGATIEVRADVPIVKFVSVPDFINMDMHFNDPRLYDLTEARQAALVAEIAAGGPHATINPHIGNFVGTVENGYRGASQVLLEAMAAENADFFTVSGDLLYTRWPNNAELDDSHAAQHIREQADIYYDGWVQNVETYGEFDLSDVYTIVGDHEVGDNDWDGSVANDAKRALIPVYREVYVDKVGNEFADGAGGAYVDSPAGFEGRTYAVQRGNLLLVGLDQFETFTNTGVYTNVGSQMASVQTDVTGAQLQWLDNTLTQANNDPSIEHIIVMAHVPIAGQSTVKIQATSSALMNVTNENGPLWQTLVEHGVDLYLPGEVHAISMQQANDVLQVVTGTNIFQPTDAPGVNNIPFEGVPLTSEQNYMVVEVYADRIDLTLKQIETKIWGFRGLNNDPLNDDPYKDREARVENETAEAGFQVTGTLTIDTSSGNPVYRNRSGLFVSSWTFGAPPLTGTTVDLNGDGEIDVDDVRDFFAGMHTNMTGLSIEQAFARGDLNGDLQNNYVDFRIFKIGFELAHSEEGFAAAVARASAPEPASVALGMTAMLCLGGGRFHRRLDRPAILAG